MRRSSPKKVLKLPGYRCCPIARMHSHSTGPARGVRKSLSSGRPNSPAWVSPPIPSRPSKACPARYVARHHNLFIECRERRSDPGAWHTVEGWAKCVKGTRLTDSATPGACAAFQVGRQGLTILHGQPSRKFFIIYGDPAPRRSRAQLNSCNQWEPHPLQSACSRGERTVHDREHLMATIGPEGNVRTRRRGLVDIRGDRYSLFELQTNKQTNKQTR